MAAAASASPSKSKSKTNKSYHVRSVSLPSRPHPLDLQFTELLDRLISSDGASSSSPPPAKLRDLNDLYDSARSLLLLPLNRHGLSMDTHDRLIDQALDRSLTLLDVVSAISDVLSQARENAQSLQSILRRRRVNGLHDTSSFAGFYATGKSIKKIFHKYEKGLRELERRYRSSDDPAASMSLARIFGDVEEATISVLQFLLTSIYSAGTSPSKSLKGWSLVSSMVRSRSFGLSLDFEEELKAVASDLMDSEAGKLGGRESREEQCRNVLERMERLESSIEDCQGELHRLLRNLITMRVSILNARNDYL